ncbi:MAG: FAD-dependent oxidoreductase [Phormidesmis sp.]
MSKEYDYELVVIGAGSGGLAAAKRAAKLGKKVAIIEKNVVGGTCVNRGCIPTKLMIYAAEFAKQQVIACDYGWINPKGCFDWPIFKQAMDDHIESIRRSQADSLKGVDLIRGEAEFVDAHTLKVEGQAIAAKFVLLAVGGQPMMPDMPGIEHATDSRGAIDWETLPDSIVVVGGGYIGVEFAQVLKSFGCQVTIVESNSLLLDGFDGDVQARVKQFLIDDGIEVVDGVRLQKIVKKESLTAHLSNGKTLQAEQILCALGRTPNTDRINLEAVGIETEKGMVTVNQQGRSQVSNIFAVGDCTATMLLTPVAKAEGTAAVEAMFGEGDASVDYRWIPSAVFTHPEVAMVGLTERAARDQYDNIVVRQNTFTPLKYAITATPLEAFIKVVADAENQKILGLHMVGPRAADLVQAMVPALKKGLSLGELSETIAIHPSTGEEMFCLET